MNLGDWQIGLAHASVVRVPGFVSPSSAIKINRAWRNQSGL